MRSARAVLYRRLALVAKEKADADLLRKLADERDQGLLCAAELPSAWPSFKSEQPTKAKAQFAWKFSDD